MTRQEFLAAPDQVLVGQLCGSIGGSENRIDVDGYAIVCVLHRGLPYQTHGAKKLFSAGRIDGPAVVEFVGPAVAVARLREVLAG